MCRASAGQATRGMRVALTVPSGALLMIPPGTDSMMELTRLLSIGGTYS